MRWVGEGIFSSQELFSGLLPDCIFFFWNEQYDIFCLYPQETYLQTKYLVGDKTFDRFTLKTFYGDLPAVTSSSNGGQLCRALVNQNFTKI